MPFFVRITPRSARERADGALYGFELSEDELIERVVGPYERGETITLGGRSLPTGDITKIVITKAEDGVKAHPLIQLRAKWTSGNRRGMGDWLAQNAQNVTDRCVTGPPGSKAEGGSEEPKPGRAVEGAARSERGPGTADGSEVPRPITAGAGALAVVVA